MLPHQGPLKLLKVPPNSSGSPQTRPGPPNSSRSLKPHQGPPQLIKVTSNSKELVTASGQLLRCRMPLDLHCTLTTSSFSPSDDYAMPGSLFGPVLLVMSPCLHMRMHTVVPDQAGYAQLVHAWRIRLCYTSLGTAPHPCFVIAGLHNSVNVTVLD